MRSDTVKLFSDFADLKVFCAEHVGYITVFSKCLKKHIKDIQRWLISFLSQKGIITANTSVSLGKLFRPDSFLKYSSFN